jgi:hypothetical protein
VRLSEKNGNANSIGHKFFQKVQPFCDHLVRKKIDARRVTSRPCEACDKTELNWVLRDTEYDRDRRGCGSGHDRTGRVGRHCNQGYAPADKIGHEDR